MINTNETCTKEKTISYEQRLFIKTSLRQLGINPKNNGFRYLQKAIIYAYKNDIISINLYDIYRYLSKKTNTSFKTIESIITYSFSNINTKKLSTNYSKIFGIDFSFDFFNIRNLISDFLDILEEFE